LTPGIDAKPPRSDGKIVAGYDYLDGDNSPNDTYGHGIRTWRASLLAETNNSSRHYAGVGYSPNIRVMPLRVCDENGCPTTPL
jgi:thermitase